MSGKQAKADEPIYAGVSLSGPIKVVRPGALPNNPQYTVPKDENQSMLAIYERRSRAVPAPGHANTELTWKSVGAKFSGKEGEEYKRKTFCDDAINHSRKVPSPCKYEPKQDTMSR